MKNTNKQTYINRQTFCPTEFNGPIWLNCTQTNYRKTNSNRNLQAKVYKCTTKQDKTNQGKLSQKCNTYTIQQLLSVIKSDTKPIIHLPAGNI